MGEEHAVLDVATQEAEAQRPQFGGAGVGAASVVVVVGEDAMCCLQIDRAAAGRGALLEEFAHRQVSVAICVFERGLQVDDAVEPGELDGVGGCLEDALSPEGSVGSAEEHDVISLWGMCDQ